MLPRNLSENFQRSKKSLIEKIKNCTTISTTPKHAGAFQSTYVTSCKRKDTKFTCVFCSPSHQVWGAFMKPFGRCAGYQKNIRKTSSSKSSKGCYRFGCFGRCWLQGISFWMMLGRCCVMLAVRWRPNAPRWGNLGKRSRYNFKGLSYQINFNIGSIG